MVEWRSYQTVTLNEIMSYPLLQAAPLNHFSKEFISFLYDHNKVILDDENWIVIENAKYHKKDSPWLTAFFKGTPHNWHCHLKVLLEIWGDWKWVKKAKSKQTIMRPHIHLIKE